MAPGAETGGEGDVDIANLGCVPTPKVEGEWTVEKAMNQVSGQLPVEGSSSPLPFFHLLERLKTTKREGWKRFGIDKCESISDHMYRMSILSMIPPPALAARLDLPRCTKMCLIHDMAELLVGDITPIDGVPKPEKSRRESTTMDYLTKNLLSGVHGGLAGQEIRAIWQEYEDSETLESKYVHDLDKIELLLQMVEYERRARRTVDLGEFAYVESRISLDEMKDWGKQVLKERDEFWGEEKHVNGEVLDGGGVADEVRKGQEEYYKR